MPGDACRSGNFDLLERYPKIHEIRSASDMVHPASTPENPITAAYVLVIRDRSPELERPRKSRMRAPSPGWSSRILKFGGNRRFLIRGQSKGDHVNRYPRILTLVFVPIGRDKMLGDPDLVLHCLPAQEPSKTAWLVSTIRKHFSRPVTNAD